MSRMVNCPNEVLVNLCHNDLWYDIIKQHNHVRIPEDNPIDLSSYVRDEPKTEWEVLDRDGVCIHSRSAFVDEVRKAPHKMLIHANDIYVYESEPMEKGKNGDGYGVLVSSSLGKKVKCLKRFWEINTEAGKECSWKTFFENFHRGTIVPSNAIVIIDRYLFAYNSECKTDYRNGVRNVYAILEELLPKTFDEDYHVLLVFDDTKISRGAELKDVVKGLQKTKKDLRRPYPLTIEILTVSSNAGGIYAETHDRCIMSNYYIISATHGFSAFAPAETAKEELICNTEFSTWSQRLRFEAIFAGIDNEDRMSLPVRINDGILSKLRNYIETLRDNDNGFYYICNGNTHVDVADLKNRLIRDSE